MDSSDEEETEALANVLSMASAWYADTYYWKEPCRTSELTGKKWVDELREGNAVRIFESFRMTKPVFSSLCNELEELTSSSSWSRVETEEKVAVFLYAAAKNASNRDLQERFQRSGETIHRHFHDVLDAICSLAPKYIVLPSHASAEMAANPKFHGQFANCRLAFDGTHIPAYVCGDKAKVYRDRNGKLSQNVFAACTFDMRFAFVLAGWEGSAADSTIHADARQKGFDTPAGLFDLGDAGFSLSLDVLTPYRGVRYHLREWSQQLNPFANARKQ